MWLKGLDVEIELGCEDFEFFAWPGDGPIALVVLPDDEVVAGFHCGEACADSDGDFVVDSGEEFADFFAVAFVVGLAEFDAFVFVAFFDIIVQDIGGHMAFEAVWSSRPGWPSGISGFVHDGGGCDGCQCCDDGCSEDDCFGFHFISPFLRML